MIRLIGSTLALLLALAQTARAQDDRWQVTLDDERYVWDIRLVRLDGDSLVVRQSDSLVSVPVAHINEIRLIRKSEVHVRCRRARRRGRDERPGRRGRRGLRPHAARVRRPASDHPEDPAAASDRAVAACAAPCSPPSRRSRSRGRVRAQRAAPDVRRQREHPGSRLGVPPRGTGASLEGHFPRAHRRGPCAARRGRPPRQAHFLRRQQQHPPLRARERSAVRRPPRHVRLRRGRRGFRGGRRRRTPDRVPRRARPARPRAGRRAGPAPGSRRHGGERPRRRIGRRRAARRWTARCRAELRVPPWSGRCRRVPATGAARWPARARDLAGTPPLVSRRARSVPAAAAARAGLRRFRRRARRRPHGNRAPDPGRDPRHLGLGPERCDPLERDCRRRDPPAAICPSSRPRARSCTSTWRSRMRPSPAGTRS